MIPSPLRCLPIQQDFPLLVGRLVDDGADGALGRGLEVGVRVDFALVVAQGGVGDGADVPRLGVAGGRVVRREDVGDGADHGANGLVQGFGLGRADDLGQGGAGFGVRKILRRKDAGMFVEVVVVVSRGLCHGADLSRLVHVELGVSRGEDRVGRADDGTDFGHTERREVFIEVVKG